MEAGFVGETYADRFLHQIDFPKSHAIFKGLHIQTGPQSYLQVDTLIVTQKYIAILEIKNIKGKVYFQKNPKQLVRELNGQSETYKCPEQQILRHQIKLQKLLSHLKIDLPIHNRIVFAFSSTHIVEPPEEVKVLMACDLPNHIDKLNQLPDVIRPTTFKKLVQFLTTHLTTYHPTPIAEQFQFDWSSLKTGVFCPSCNMKISSQMRCPSCKISRQTLYHLALEEWFYLCKTSISNKECVHFLDLKDKYAASYLFKKFDLESQSHNKYRRYLYTNNFWITKESTVTDK